MQGRLKTSIIIISGQSLRKSLAKFDAHTSVEAAKHITRKMEWVPNDAGMKTESAKRGPKCRAHCAAPAWQP